ncbi:MAG: crotonobetaine/carnitine-CoA ligase [Raoultibacter sp.]
MTDIIGNETLRSLWDGLATTQGEKTFLIFQGRQGAVTEFTYKQFNDEINKAANLFLARGIQRDEKVAVQLHTSPEFMMCLFGLAKIGAVMVPMNEQYLQEECEYVLNKCEATTAIIEPEFLSLYQAIQARDGFLPKGIVLARNQGVTSGDAAGTDDFDALRAAQPTTLREVRPLDATDAVEIIFTSGTTSRPKGVVLTHCNVLYTGVYGDWEVSLHAEDRLLTTMPACHSNFQLAAMTPVICAGATLIVIEKYSAKRFWQQVRDYRATVTQCVAMMVRTLLMQPVAPQEKDHCVREVLYFMPLAQQEKQAFEQRFGARIMNTYGSTESLVWVLTDPPTGARKWPSVGRVGLSCEVKIVDDALCEVAAGHIGEILVHGIPGRTIMKEYYGDPEETARTITPDGWMHTGDKGYVDAQGWFYFVDRKVNMIKRAGENISTTELENVLTTHPAIAEAAVIGVPDPVRDQAVKAFVLPVAGQQLSVAEVAHYCKQHMAAFKVPSFIEVVESFPHTCSMKIEKKLLK